MRPFLPSSTAQHWAEDAVLMHRASHHQDLPIRRHQRADMHLNHAFTASTSTNNAVIRSLLIRSMMLFLADFITTPCVCNSAQSHQARWASASIPSRKRNSPRMDDPEVSSIHRCWAPCMQRQATCEPPPLRVRTAFASSHGDGVGRLCLLDPRRPPPHAQQI